ncbi:MAG: APC family permease [Phycisphaerales bacterium]
MCPNDNSSGTEASPANPEPLPRSLGALALWLLCINGIIGAGIFGAPAKAELLTGEFSPWVFAMGALLIAPIMLCFAWLSARFTGTGGPMLYAGTAFGPFVGFQVGWTFYIARMLAFGANLNLLVATIEYFSPQPFGPALRVGLLFVLCASMVWVNIAGARATMGSLGLLTLLKLLPLVALALAGLSHLDAGVFTTAASPPPIADLGTAALLVIYAYVGFESGLVPAGESKDPKRDLPRALLFALLVSASLYVLIQIAARSLVPDLAQSERPLVDAGESMIGPAGAVIVSLAIIFSVGANLLSSIFSAPRLTYRLALEGQLPALFARVHRTHGTPWISIAFYGAGVFVLAATGSFAWLAVLSVFARLLLYMTCVASMARIRPRSEDGQRPFQLPGGPAIPVLAILVCVGLLTQVGVDSVLATGGLLAIGTMLFLIAHLRNRASSRSSTG